MPSLHAPIVIALLVVTGLAQQPQPHGGAEAGEHRTALLELASAIDSCRAHASTLWAARRGLEECLETVLGDPSKTRVADFEREVAQALGLVVEAIDGLEGQLAELPIVELRDSFRERLPTLAARRQEYEVRSEAAQAELLALHTELAELGPDDPGNPERRRRLVVLRSVRLKERYIRGYAEQCRTIETIRRTLVRLIDTCAVLAAWSDDVRKDLHEERDWLVDEVRIEGMQSVLELLEEPLIEPDQDRPSPELMLAFRGWESVIGVLERSLPALQCFVDCGELFVGVLEPGLLAEREADIRRGLQELFERRLGQESPAADGRWF